MEAECAGPGGTPVPFTVTATNLCQPNVPVSCTPSSGSLFPLGSTTVTCVAVDNFGGINHYSFPVTVADTTPPVLANVPGDLTVECDRVPPPSTVTVGDRCDEAPILDYRETIEAGACPDRYIIRRLWTALDHCGDGTNATQTILVRDSTPPVFLQCPSDIVVTADAGECSAVVTYPLLATDNCTPHPALVCAPSYGASFPVGISDVVWTATDDCGNPGTCAFRVTVLPSPHPLAIRRPFGRTCWKSSGAFPAESSRRPRKSPGRGGRSPAR